MTGLTAFEVTKDSVSRLAAVKAKGRVIALAVVFGAGAGRAGVRIRQVQAQCRGAIASRGRPRGAVTAGRGRVAGTWR